MTIGQWLSFQGRIGRKTFWLGYVLPLFLAGIVAAVVDGAMGFGINPGMDAMPMDRAGLTPVSSVVSLLSIWPSLAGTIKRLHDRDRSGWWIGGFYLVSIAFGVAAGVMAAMQPYDMAGIAVVLIGGGVLLFGYAIWLLVELGFLRGSMGPNRFGPDPLGGVAPQWQQTQPGWQGQPQWQQPQQWQPPQQPQWQQPQPQWQPPPQQGWQAPPQGPGAPPPGYGQPPPGYGQPPGSPPGYGQQPPPPGYGQPPPGGSVPPVRRD